MVALVILGVALAIIGVAIIYIDGDIIDLVGILAIFTGGVLIGIFFNRSAERNNPPAIDVYRNKTELQITEIRRDSLVIERDTLVVFKEQYYGRTK